MFWPGRILLAGGSDGRTATNTAELIDLTSGSIDPQTGYKQPIVTRAPNMRYPRYNVNSTILPDGTVLLTGGARIASSAFRSMGVLDAEIWTPPPYGTGASPGGTWTTVAPMKEARMYHSTAVLLPDGRVLSAGGEEVIKYNPFTPNLNNHCTAELYSPPYLFDAAGNPRARPTINGAPAHVGYGQPFTVVATAHGGTLARVTLVRLSSVTHSFNMNQRFLELPVTASLAGTSLSVTAPPNAEECPPGHYLLFVLNSNGTPSVGQVVHINASACAAAPELRATYALSPDGCAYVATVTVSGANLGTDYQWTINGGYDKNLNGQLSVSVDLNPCEPQATFGVRVTPSCGGTPVENFMSVSKRFSAANCPCGSL